MTWLLVANLAAATLLAFAEWGLWRDTRRRNAHLARIAGIEVLSWLPHGKSLHPCDCGYALVGAKHALKCGGTVHACDRCQPETEALP